MSSETTPKSDLPIEISLDKLEELSREIAIQKDEEEIDFQKEVELSLLIEKGDETALHELTASHLDLVEAIAKQFQYQGLSLPDLILEGNIGLVKAAKRFNSNIEARFSAYAVWWIRQSILQALAEHSKLSRTQIESVEMIVRIRDEYKKLEDILNREPTDKELAEALEISEKELVKMDLIQASQQDKGAPIFPLVKRRTQSLIQQWFELIKSSNLDVNVYLSKADKDEKKIFKYILDQHESSTITMEQLASEANTSQSQVKKLIEKGIRKARYFVRSN